MTVEESNKQMYPPEHRARTTTFPFHSNRQRPDPQYMQRHRLLPQFPASYNSSSIFRLNDDSPPHFAFASTLPPCQDATSASSLSLSPARIVTERRPAAGDLRSLRVGFRSDSGSVLWRRRMWRARRASRLFRRS